MSEEILVHATWIARDGYEGHVSRALRELRTATVKEPGNRLYRIAYDPQRPTEFHLFEVYADPAALDAHRDSEHFITWAANYAIPLLERREVILYRSFE